MSHTRKHIVKSVLGEFADATIYTSGGTTHTVHVMKYDGDRVAEEYRKTFRGENAYNRALTFAQDVTDSGDCMALHQAALSTHPMPRDASLDRVAREQMRRES